MQAIQTKFLGATSFKGSRIKATCAAGSITIDYPHHLSGEGCHALAAMALVRKLEWAEYGNGTWRAGCLADGSYVFVLTGDDSYSSYFE